MRFLAIILSLIPFLISSQTVSVSVSLTTTKYICEKGSANISISGGKLPYTVNWSNGKSNVYSIQELEEGDYSVTVADSTAKDTTINFRIEKEECPVVISNQFTPNGDSYNDTWQIGHADYYPDFDLYVYNKWGQEVHHQSKTYSPWNGQSQGVSVPDGTYYYVFYFFSNDKKKFLKGDVTILR